MGIRIKKALGYGVTVPYAQANDVLNMEALRMRASLKLSDYKTFLENKYAGQQVDEQSRDYVLSDNHQNELFQKEMLNFGWRSISVVDTNEHDEDAENPSMHIVITPLSCLDDWQHFDDDIDFYEHAYRYQNDEKDSMEPSMKFFNHGLFPYEGPFVNHKTGLVVDGRKYRHAKTFLEMPAPSKASDIVKGVEYINGLLAELGVVSGEELREHILPAPPVNATDIAEFSGIFKNPDTIKRLRPSLLTYWN